MFFGKGSLSLLRARFNFSGADQQKKAENLSGGEHSRVHPAVMLKEGGNVLLLDELTNSLDVNTMRAQGALGETGLIVMGRHRNQTLELGFVRLLETEPGGEFVKVVVERFQEEALQTAAQQVRSKLIPGNSAVIPKPGAPARKR